MPRTTASVIVFAALLLSAPSVRGATGEALFLVAERERAIAERITLRAYRGPGDRTSILRYLRHDAAPWLERRLRAVLVAQRAYLRVLGKEVLLPPPRSPDPPASTSVIGLIAVVDPNERVGPDVDFSALTLTPYVAPRWAIASLERIGTLWADVVAAGRAMPVASTWPTRLASRAYPMSIIDTPFDVAERRAKGAFAACLRLSTEHRAFDERSERCERWLARNAHGEYHALDEIYLRPR